jgi:5-methylcytosine-specific restriction endonuclease McrA
MVSEPQGIAGEWRLRRPALISGTVIRRSGPGMSRGRGSCLKRMRRDYIEEEIEARGSCCQDCGIEYEPGEMFHWHHRRPTEKDFPISKPYGNMIDLGRELAKCDFLCPSCHRRRHTSNPLARPLRASTHAQLPRRMDPACYPATRASSAPTRPCRRASLRAIEPRYSAVGCGGSLVASSLPPCAIVVIRQ